MSKCLLPYDQYTLYNALLWGNFNYHYNNIWNEGDSCWKSAFHITAALLEFFPVASQIVSLAELCIGLLYYYFSPIQTTYADGFYNDPSISVACKELFKLIFIDTINPNTIDSLQPLGQLVGEKGQLTNKLRVFNTSHFGSDTVNHLGCRGSFHSSSIHDPWQTIKITAPNISELGATSPILLELKKNLDKHYHLKSGGGGNWAQWLNLSFEDKMKQNKFDPICFNQDNTIMAPQLMLTRIDLKKILGLIKSDEEYIAALEQTYQKTKA